MDDHDSGNGQGCKHPRQDAGERKMEGKKGQVKGMDMVEQHSSTGKQHASGQDRSGPRTDRQIAYSDISPLPQQHPRLSNEALPGCIVHQDFHCVVLSDVLGQAGANQCLSFHPNGLAVVQLGPTHPAVGNNDNEIVTIDFEAGGFNVLETAIVKGKKKKGALQLNPTTILCNVKTRGKEYKVCTGIFGELLQANKTLLADPGLLSSEPLGRGWLVIIRLKPRDLRRLSDVVGYVEER